MKKCSSEIGKDFYVRKKGKEWNTIFKDMNEDERKHTLECLEAFRKISYASQSQMEKEELNDFIIGFAFITKRLSKQ